MRTPAVRTLNAWATAVNQIPTAAAPDVYGLQAIPIQDFALAAEVLRIYYVGVMLFRKNVDGFTLNQQTTMPFSALGLNFSDLTTTQQQAITVRGEPATAVVTI